MNFFQRYQGGLHAIGWAVFVSLPLLTLPDFLRNRQDLISLGMAQLLTSVLMITFFYVNLRVLTPRLLRRQNTRQFMLAVGLMALSVVGVKVVSFYAFPPARPDFSAQSPPPPGGSPGQRLPGPGMGRGPGPGPRSPWPGVPGTVISLGVALLVSSMMALFRYHTRSQEVQQRMALEKISAELAMLKLQVSPHFLFNTLNNIRWLARQKSDQTEAAVVTLAQLLRYMIYQAQQDSVPLRKEVQHLQDYIDLQKMRLTDRNTVSFRCTGDIDAHQIEPLLFIPFVENAFKYGVHSQQPGHIDISLDVTDDTLTFSTENPTFDSPTGQPNGTAITDSGQTNPGGTASGIGIANVEKRLVLHYPERHELRLTNEQNQFRVVLTLHLHHDTVALPRH
ncbi:sensor histidine kinase [Spirosoma arcticum]